MLGASRVRKSRQFRRIASGLFVSGGTRNRQSEAVKTSCFPADSAWSPVCYGFCVRCARYPYLARRQSQLALGVQDQALAEIKRHLLDFIGTHTWEELCREWLLRAGDRAALPFMPDEVGSVWLREAQIDVVGVNAMEKTLILGECKWSPRPQDVPVLQGLIDKTAACVPADGHWRVHYVGFARSGWTPAAQRYADRSFTRELKGPNWQVTGLRLLNLDQVDADLAAWTG